MKSQTVASIVNTCLHFNARCVETSRVEWQALIAKFDKKRVLVLGDVGLDEYVVGQVKRISPEAPVPVVEVKEESLKLGLASNVAANVNALGGEAFTVGIVGDDQAGVGLAALFERAQIATSGLVTSVRRPTVRKTRIMADHHHVVRVDYESSSPIARAEVDSVLAKFNEHIGHVDVVIVEDYAKGLVTPAVMEAVLQSARDRGVPVLVDPNRKSNLALYKGVDLIKPNWDEALELTRNLRGELKTESSKDLIESLRSATGAKEVVVTMGKQGMAISESKGELAQVPTYAQQVFDVTGAGDTVIAVLGLAKAAGLDLLTGARLANFAAGYVVSKVGCVTSSQEDLLRFIEEHPDFQSLSFL